MSATIDADGGSQLLYAGSDQYLAVNLDTAVTVYISQSRTVYTSDIPLPPQASVQLSGPWYVSTCDHGTVAQIAILPGSAGGYSNPVGVQIALASLGLAKDTSVQAVHTTLGSPAQDSSVAAISAQDGWPSSGLSTDDTLFNRLSLVPNGQFPGGLVQAGWGGVNCTVTGVTTQPAGGPRKWAAHIVPSGSATSWAMQGMRIPVTAGAVLDIRGIMYPVANTAGATYSINASWYNSAGTLLSTTKSTVYLASGFWINAGATFTVPAGAVLARIQFQATATATIPTSDDCYIEDISAHSSAAGMGPTNVQPLTTTASLTNQNPGTPTILALGSGMGARVYAVWVTASISVGASYSPGANFNYVRVNSAALGVLAEVTLPLQASSTVAWDSQSLAFPNPVFLPAGDTVTLDVNGGSPISGTTQRGSGGLVYSSP